MRMRGNSVARSLIQRMASRFSRNGSMSNTSGRCCRTSLFASSKVCAGPQTWYRGSRPIIATKPCSPIIVSPTATTRIGSVPAHVVALFFTVLHVLTNRSGPLQYLIASFTKKFAGHRLTRLVAPFFTERARRSSQKIFSNAEKNIC